MAQCDNDIQGCVPWTDDTHWLAGQDLWKAAWNVYSQTRSALRTVCFQSVQREEGSHESVPTHKRVQELIDFILFLLNL